MAASAPIFLICGIPGTGKSTFAHWLEENKGFLCLTVEEEEPLHRAGLATVWEEVFTKGAVRQFVETLRMFNRPIVIDWGFPPSCLEAVRALQDAGVKLWWFEGDRQAARRKFIERGTAWVQCMDIQLQALQNESKALASLIGGHVLNVLDKDGTSLPPEAIYAHICETA